MTNNTDNSDTILLNINTIKMIKINVLAAITYYICFLAIIVSGSNLVTSNEYNIITSQILVGVMMVSLILPSVTWYMFIIFNYNDLHEIRLLSIRNNNDYIRLSKRLLYALSRVYKYNIYSYALILSIVLFSLYVFSFNDNGISIMNFNITFTHMLIVYEITGFWLFIMNIFAFKRFNIFYGSV